MSGNLTNRRGWRYRDRAASLTPEPGAETCIPYGVDPRTLPEPQSPHIYLINPRIPKKRPPVYAEYPWSPFAKVPPPLSTQPKCAL